MNLERANGIRWRRPEPADAEAILGLITACNTPLVGSADCTLDDVRDELEEPGFDSQRDAWIVVDAGGAVNGYGWAKAKSGSDLVEVEAISADPAVSGWLWDRILGRAAEIGAEAGYREVTIDIGIYQVDRDQQSQARARDFRPATTFQRMRVDFDGPPDDPAVPPGVVVRTGPGGEDLHRDAHGVWARAFVDHFGFVDTPFDRWHAAIGASASHDWAQLRVAYLGGAPVAMVRGADHFVEDENCGYVATVAVAPEARGRGLASLLLRQAFADDFRRGRRGTILHVDANNTTPALDLYRHVGMRPGLALDVWRRRVITG